MYDGVLLRGLSRERFYRGSQGTSIPGVARSVRPCGDSHERQWRDFFDIPLACTCEKTSDERWLTICLTGDIIGKKQSVYKIPQAAPVNPADPIEDDPYWTVTASGVPDRFAVRHFKRFQSFQKYYGDWVRCLLDGFPTFYCLLGVHKGTPKEQIYKAYITESEKGFFPDYLYEDAIRVLMNSRIQTAYDELLFVFGEYAKQMPQSTRDELIRKHSDYIAQHKSLRILRQLQTENRDYSLLYASGMPDIYEISGQKPDADHETIQRECRQDSDLFRKIYAILTDPVSREKYDHFLFLLNKHEPAEVSDHRKKKRILWKHLDRKIFDTIILSSLTESDRCFTLASRYLAIRNANQDWIEYLPPEKETFFSILGLDADSIRSMDKKEIEGVIRNNYRELPKTPRVNLAYSVLKNMTLREDYLWFVDNHPLAHAIITILVREKDPKTNFRQEHATLNLWGSESPPWHRKR